MRLFIAIDLPKEIKDHLYNLQSKVKDAKSNWVAKSKLHITLKFLGEVEEGKLEEIKQRIQVQHPSFQLTLASLGFFPNAEDPKVIWVGVQPEDGLRALQQKVDGELLTMFPDEQQFKAHITLGRVKTIRRKESFQKSLRELEVKSITFEVKEFTLYSSNLRRGGASYEVIENVTLS